MVSVRVFMDRPWAGACRQPVRGEGDRGEGESWQNGDFRPAQYTLPAYIHGDNKKAQIFLHKVRLNFARELDRDVSRQSEAAGLASLGGGGALALVLGGAAR